MAYVYRFYVGGEIKYIGHTENMKARMSTHFSRVPGEYDCKVLTVEQVLKVTRVDYTETGKSNARVLEAYLIAKEKPEWNKDFVEDDDLTFTLNTGELEWREWEVNMEDNPHHHMFVWRRGDIPKHDVLLYEVPKTHEVFDALCRELGIEADMNFMYGKAQYVGEYKIMRITEKRHIRTGKEAQRPKYSFMGYPERWRDGEYKDEYKDDTDSE